MDAEQTVRPDQQVGLPLQLIILRPLWVSEIMRNPSTPVVPMLCWGGGGGLPGFTKPLLQPTAYPLVSLELLDGEYKDYVASVANPSLNLVNLTKMKKVRSVILVSSPLEF